MIKTHFDKKYNFKEIFDTHPGIMSFLNLED